MKRSFPLILLCATIALAEHYDASVFGALQWRSIGPQRGGRSITSAGSTSRPNEYYFGAVGGGLWKTTDGGTTWKPVTDGQLKSSSVGAVAVSESNPDVVYHRHGRDRTARQHHAGRRRLQIDRRRQDVEAHRPRRHAGDLAHSHRSDESRYRLRRRRSAIPTARMPSAACSARSDGGKTWQKILYRNDHAGAVDLCIDPHNSQGAVRGASGTSYRTRGRLSSGGPLQRPLSNRPTAAITGPRSPATRDCRNGIIGKIGVAVSAAIPIASTRWWKPKTAALFRLRRRRRDLDAGQRRSPHPPARVLLLAHLRRSES